MIPAHPDLRGPASQLLNAAEQLETLDDDLARETYLEALAAAMYAGRLGEPDALANAAEAAHAAVGPGSELDQPMDLLLSGMADRIGGGVNGGRDVLRSTLELLCAPTNSQVQRWMLLAFPVVQEIAARRTVGPNDLPSNGATSSAGSRRRRTGHPSPSARLPGESPRAGR